MVTGGAHNRETTATAGNLLAQSYIDQAPRLRPGWVIGCDWPGQTIAKQLLRLAEISAAMDLQARQDEYKPGRIRALLLGHAEQLIALFVPAVCGKKLARSTSRPTLAGLDRHGLARVPLPT